MQPRQELLDIWRAITRASYVEQAWTWGGRQGRNSISDAEQLLCLMAPAAAIGALRLDLPDETAEDVLDALAAMGDSVELPRRLLHIAADYLRTYADASGTPIFSGGSYFASFDSAMGPTAVQRDLDVVDSFARSVQLSLAIVGFVRIFKSVLTREDLRRDAESVETMASTRLSAAMVGLLRSFAVHVFDVNSAEGQTLCRTVNQTSMSQRRVLDELHRELREVRAGLRDLTVAGEPVDLENPNLLFECGWSWGICKDVPTVATAEAVGRQAAGVAQAAPYLYFTVVALESIRDLFTERTRILGLLNEEQHRLAQALQVRWDLTQSYWSTVASFGDGRWPLEDIPWRTTDELESDYFTLLVTSITVQALASRPATDIEVSRVATVLADLAGRARITRRPFADDSALLLHAPGVAIGLEGTEDAGDGGGPRLCWLVSDFSPQLLERTIRVAGMLATTERRAHVLSLAESVWEHLWRRRLRSGPAAGLWDQPSEVYPDVKPAEPEPSWYYTVRVVEALVSAAGLVASPPVRGLRASELTADLLAEAEHLFDQELLLPSSDAGPAIATVLQTARTTLGRARELLPDRPATALVLVSDVLRQLDRLAAARSDPSGRS